MKQLMVDNNTAASHSFLLDDDSSIPFSLDDIQNLMDEKVRSPLCASFCPTISAAQCDDHLGVALVALAWTHLLLGQDHYCILLINDRSAAVTCVKLLMKEGMTDKYRTRPRVVILVLSCNTGNVQRGPSAKGLGRR